LNVLHISSEKTWRGGEQQIAYLLDELSKQGINNTVLVRKNSSFETYCRERKIDFVSVSFSGLAILKAAFRISAICRKRAINIVHMHSSKGHTVGVLSILFWHKAKLVLSRRVDFPVKKNWFAHWKYNHPRIERILCVSHEIERIVKKSLTNPEKAITIHSGIDLNKFKNMHKKASLLRKEFAIPDDTLLVGNTSALAGHKDYFTFIDTIEILIAKELAVKAVIMGTGPLEQTLKSYVEQKKLSDFIFFAGFRNNIPGLLPDLDVFLITSTEEGLGTSVLDAFASGVPVVATKAGGIPEMVVDRETGLLAGIKNAHQLADNIQLISENAELRLKLIQNAKELSKKFSKEETAAKTAKIYFEVTTGSV